MRKLILVFLATVLLFGISAFAQDKFMRANIPFDFTVGTKHMPAGTYDVRVADNTRQVTLKNLTTNDVAMIEVMTRLSADPTKRDTDTLTFDVTPESTVLETYWPKMEDGFLLNATPGKHTHKSVTLG